VRQKRQADNPAGGDGPKGACTERTTWLILPLASSWEQGGRPCSLSAPFFCSAGWACALGYADKAGPLVEVHDGDV
jgi:hypothetical protein